MVSLQLLAKLLADTLQKLNIAGFLAPLAASTSIASLEKLEMLGSNLEAFLLVCCIVIVHKLAQDLIVHLHSLIVLACCGVQLRQEDGELQCCRVQSTPNPCKIVADILAKVDSSVVVAAAEACLDESASQRDDH